MLYFSKAYRHYRFIFYKMYLGYEQLCAYFNKAIRIEFYEFIKTSKEKIGIWPTT